MCIMYNSWSSVNFIQTAFFLIILYRFNFLFKIKYDALRKADSNYKKMSTAMKQLKYAEAAQAVMAPVAQSVRPLHPSKVWEDISPQFLVTFWSLSMYDLYVPVESYQREINKLKQLAAQTVDSKDMVQYCFQYQGKGDDLFSTNCFFFFFSFFFIQ